VHSNEREKAILDLLQNRGFVSFQELDRTLDASPATLRRDLSRLETLGKLTRVHGGARAVEATRSSALTGVPFHENVARNHTAKEAIGRAAAELCRPGEAVIIDGGSTTLQMCPHLEPLGLQVLTNSLHVVSALLNQANTRVSVPAGALFREQNIILSPFEDDGMERFHAGKLFMGAAAIGPRGLMQADTLLMQSERRMLERVDELYVLADSSKFTAPAGHVFCDLSSIDVLITDDGISAEHARMIESASVRLIITKPATNGA
jgi:DeoR family ulaG and ulaABCDEF operon transcriptional repressor